MQVAGQAKSPGAQVAVLAVVGGVDTRQAGQRFREAAPAKGLDFIAGDDAGRIGDLILFLLVFGGADNGHIQQLLQTQGGELVFLRSNCRAGQQRRSRQNQR